MGARRGARRGDLQLGGYPAIRWNSRIGRRSVQAAAICREADGGERDYDGFECAENRAGAFLRHADYLRTGRCGV